jgi:hypothetical protein
VSVVGRKADGTASERGGTSITIDDVAPSITVTGAGEPGVPGTITFASRMQQVTSYTYTIDSGQELSVPAGPGGTATVAWTPTHGSDWIYLVARAHNAGGYVSNQGVTTVAVNDRVRMSSPQFPQNGSGPLVTGTFTLAPRQLGIVDYQYTVDGQPWVTVPAGPDGTASFTWTPPRKAVFQFQVVSRNEAGKTSNMLLLYNIQVT